MIILSLEGLDKSGKANQTTLLTRRLKDSGYLTKQSEFHRYDTPTGELIMKWLKKEWDVSQKTIELILSADKQAQQDYFKSMESLIDFLVLDRYTLSQYAYSLASGIDAMWTYQLQRYMRMPNLNIIIDIPPEVSMSRKGKHNNGENDRYESDYELLNKVRGNYIAYANSHEEECIVIDGEQSIEDIHNEIWNCLLIEGIVKNRK